MLILSMLLRSTSPSIRILLLLVCAGLLFPFVPTAQAQPDAGDVPAPGDLVVNEILYDAPTGSEYIELVNRSDRSLNLRTVTYADGNLDFDPVAPSDVLLAPGEYVVLVDDPTAFEAAFPGVAFLDPPDWEALNNGGDRVELRADGRTIDAVVYDDAWGGDDDLSLERVDPFGPSSEAVNWSTTTAASGGTPGAENSVFAVDTTPPVLQRATPNATGDSLRVVFSEPLDPATVSPAQFSVAPSGSIGNAAPAADAAVVQVAFAAPLPTGDYTLTVSGIADPRGNVLERGSVGFAIFQAAAPAPGDLVVNEVLYDPDRGSEYVELFNRSEKTFDLQDLLLSDNREEPVPITDRITPVRPGDFVVLVDDGEAFAQVFPGVAAVPVARWPALNNSGDTPTVWFGETRIDAVPYTSGWGGDDDLALERKDPGGPSDSATNFGPATAPAGGTPGAQNSIFAIDATPPTLRFAEQTDATTVVAFASEPLDAATVVPAAFSLNGAPPQTATLTGAATVRLAFASVASGAVTARGVADLSGNVQTETAVPLALRPRAGDVAINELLFDPLADDFDDRPNQPEYVELANRSATPLALSRLFLTDRPDESGEADTLRIGQRVALPPNGFAVVYAADEPTDDPTTASLLARAFPDIGFGDMAVALLPVDASSLGLVNSGDVVHLQRGDGATLDSVAYDPDWHAEALDETKGTALERISVTGPANAADNWTSSPSRAGGTPGQPNRIALAPAPSAPPSRIAISPSPFSIDRDGATRIQYRLDDAADLPSLLRVRVYDARGRLVRQLEDARLAGPTGELLWNGRDDAGHRVRVGIYVVLFEAVNARGGTVLVEKKPVVVGRVLN